MLGRTTKLALEGCQIGHGHGVAIFVVGPHERIKMGFLRLQWSSTCLPYQGYVGMFSLNCSSMSGVFFLFVLYDDPMGFVYVTSASTKKNMR